MSNDQFVYYTRKSNAQYITSLAIDADTVSQYADKQTVTIGEIARAIRECPLPKADLVVGIGSGGIVPASLIAFHLGIPLKTMWLNYRDPDNRPRFADPKLVSFWTNPDGAGTILLVDDVSVSGKTLDAAKRLLAGLGVTTVVMKGKADYVLLPDISTCVHWPWSKPHNQSANES